MSLLFAALVIRNIPRGLPECGPRGDVKMFLHWCVFIKWGIFLGGRGDCKVITFSLPKFHFARNKILEHFHGKEISVDFLLLKSQIERPTWKEKKGSNSFSFLFLSQELFLLIIENLGNYPSVFNSHSVKCALSKCPVWRIRPHVVYLRHPQKVSRAHWQSSLLPSQPQATTDLISIPRVLLFLEISYKWHHKICRHLCLASCT